MKLIYALTLFLITTGTAYSQYTASWGNNAGGNITRDQFLNDSLVLNSVNDPNMNYVITSFSFSYNMAGFDFSCISNSNKLTECMKIKLRQLETGRRFWIFNIKAIANSDIIKIPNGPTFRLSGGPEACLRRKTESNNAGELLTGKFEMTIKEFLNNDIIDVYIPEDYLPNRTDQASRIDTTYTVLNYSLEYSTPQYSTQKIFVGSNRIPAEIKEVVRMFTNKTLKHHKEQYLRFRYAEVKDSLGNIFYIRGIRVKLNIKYEYFYPHKDSVHPGAKALLTDEFLFSPTEGLAPLGKKSYNTFIHFKQWRKSHLKESPEGFISERLYDLSLPRFNLNTTNYTIINNYIEKSRIHYSYLLSIDRIILTVAFAQLYLEGEIEKGLFEITEAALSRQLNPKILSKYSSNYKERKYKLKKLLEIIRKLK